MRSSYSPVRSVQTGALGQGTNLIDHHAGLKASVRCDLLQRRINSHTHNVRAGCLVTLQVELIEDLRAA